MPVEDSYIAATARRHGLTIATNIECNAIPGRGQMEALALRVNDNGGGANHGICVIWQDMTACSWKGGTRRWRSKGRIKYRATRDSVRYRLIPQSTWREANFNPNTVARSV